MVIISERSIEKIVLDVAPKVEKLTGWDCHLSDLNIQLIRKDQFWEYVIKPALNLMDFGGLSRRKTLLETLALDLFKFIVPYIPLGVYEPTNYNLILLPNNLSPVNESGLAVVLGHELVHRCQYTNNPAFSQNFLDHAKNFGLESVGDLKNIKNSLELTKKILSGSSQSVMTLIEGDAFFVQHQLNRLYYQNAKIKQTPRLFIELLTSFSDIASSKFKSLSSLLYILKAKLGQYIIGEDFVKNEYVSKGRDAVNELYNLDGKDLHEKLGVFKNG